MRLVDLSSPIDARGWEAEPLTHTVLGHTEAAAHMTAEMKEHFDVDFDPGVLPDGELLSIDTLTLTSHTGTHVDAPAHYGSKASYAADGVPRTIDEMPLDWFHRPGVVLDLTGAGTGAVGPEHLEREFERIGHVPAEKEIVLLNTGSSRLAGTAAFFTDFAGLDGAAVGLLLDLGVHVIGTDAFSLDAPFTDMIRRYQESGDPDVLWPAHFLGRHREYCQIERLGNLDALPSHGFTVSCFPVKISGGGAGWTRAVAHIED